MKRILVVLVLLSALAVAKPSAGYVPAGCHDMIEGDCHTPACWVACISQILDGCLWDPSCY